MPKILFVSCNPTHPVNAGSRARLLSVAEALRESGWDPYLLFQDLSWGDVAAMRSWWKGDRFKFVPYRKHRALRRILHALAARSSTVMRMLDAVRSRAGSSAGTGRLELAEIDELVDPSLEQPLRAWCSAEKFDAVVVEYVYLSRVLEWVPSGTLRVIDTIDVMALGKAEADRLRYWLGVTGSQELRGLNRADVLWAIQDHEAAVFRHHSRARVATTGHLAGRPAVNPGGPATCTEVLFVGSRHAHNVEGLRAFAQRIWPLLGTCVAADRVVVAGDIQDVLGKELPFRFIGTVADLGPWYRRARVVISPIYGGTGLKVKNIEAMAHSRPVVTTPEGAVGLEAAAGKGMVVAHSDEEFARTVQLFLSDAGQAEVAGAEAGRFVDDWNRRQRQALVDSLQLPAPAMPSEPA